MKSILTASICILLHCLAWAQAPIQVSKQGKGQPILWLPGFTCPGTVWNETLQNLKKRNQSHVVSYAGFNGLQPIDTPFYATVKTALIAYVQKEKLSHLTIVGHSMGGNLAIDLAAALPGVVKKIIVIDALACMRAVMMPNVPATQIKYSSSYNKQLLQMTDTSFGNMARMIAQNMTSHPAKADSIFKWTMQADRKTYVYGYTELLKLDLREILQQVNVPTLIIGATSPSLETAQKTLEEQYAGLKNKKIVMSPKSNHFIMFDQPHWLFEQINSFLKK
jgi:pimeloyl-ACP methyl ester carboxylesterase